MKFFSAILLNIFFLLGNHAPGKMPPTAQSSTYDLIRKAIQQKKSMTFLYDGYKRLASPHVLGTNHGRQQALFMQYGGDSGSGLSADLHNNWRCFFLNKIRNIEINSDSFYTADNHSQGQSCVQVEEFVIDY